MTAGKDERLSALIDDEVTAFEARRLCDELSRSAEDRERWSRYHLIGAAMRGELSAGCKTDFSAAVMRAIGADGTVVAPRRKMGRIAGFAAAASFAAIGVLAIQMTSWQDDASAPGVAVVRTDGHTSEPPAPDLQLAAEEQFGSPAAQLDAYLLNHAEYASRPGIVPYARVVSYEADAR